MGIDVTKMIQNIFWSGILPRDINRSFIVLIPKLHGAFEFKHFRPISLYNTTYKILSKILADYIKPLISKLVASNQSALVPGWWIGENAIMANEVVLRWNVKKDSEDYWASKWTCLKHTIELIGWLLLES